MESLILLRMRRNLFDDNILACCMHNKQGRIHVDACNHKGCPLRRQITCFS